MYKEKSCAATDDMLGNPRNLIVRRIVLLKIIKRVYRHYKFSSLFLCNFHLYSIAHTDPDKISSL